MVVERRELKNYHTGHMMYSSLQSLMSGEKIWGGGGGVFCLGFLVLGLLSGNWKKTNEMLCSCFQVSFQWEVSTQEGKMKHVQKSNVSEIGQPRSSTNSRCWVLAGAEGWLAESPECLGSKGHLWKDRKRDPQTHATKVRNRDILKYFRDIERTK